MKIFTFKSDINYIKTVINSCDTYNQLINSYIWSCYVLKTKYPKKFIKEDLSTKIFNLIENKIIYFRKINNLIKFN